MLNKLTGYNKNCRTSSRLAPIRIKRDRHACSIRFPPSINFPGTIYIMKHTVTFFEPWHVELIGKSCLHTIVSSVREAKETTQKEFMYKIKRGHININSGIG